MPHGLVKSYNPETGQGFVELTNLDGTLIIFVVQPHSKYRIGDRVRFNLGTRAIQLEVDTQPLDDRIA